MDTLTQHMVRINGVQVNGAGAVVSVLDHGFLFGDSIYEVVRTVKGRPLALREHLSRLRKSAARIFLTLPWTDEYLAEEVNKAIESAVWEGETYVRLVVTRGVGEIDLMPTTCTQPNLFVISKALPTYPADVYGNGIVVCLVEVRRNSRLAMDPAIKSGNYLNNVLALIEARSKGADDAVMLNEMGYVTECTTSNIFLVKDGVVMTPELGCGILAGITRALLIPIIHRAGIPVEETVLTISDLAGADEIFLTGTIKGVMPVREMLGMVEWRRGPGPMTRQIRELYEKAVGLID